MNKIYESEEEEEEVGGVIKNLPKDRREEKISKKEEKKMKKEARKMTSVGEGQGLSILKNPEIQKRILDNPPPSQQTPPTVTPEATPPKVTPPAGLPDLPDIKPMTEYEQKAAEAEVLARRKFAEAAGEKLAVINREIASIEAEPEKIALSPILQKRLVELKGAKEKIASAGDEGLQKRTEFASFLASIRIARPEEAGKYVVEALATKRIRPTEASSGTNILFWAGKIYEPAPDSTGKITPATLGLMAELRKLVAAEKSRRREEFKVGVIALKAIANLTLAQIVEGREGTAYGFLPAKEEKLKDGTIRRDGESHFTVVCDGKVIRPGEAEGRLRNFWSQLAEKQRFITLYDLREGRLTGRKLPEDIFKEAVGFLKILQAAIRVEAEKVKTAPPATPPTPPAVETETPAKTKGRKKVKKETAATT